MVLYNCTAVLFHVCIKCLSTQSCLMKEREICQTFADYYELIRQGILLVNQYVPTYPVVENNS